MDTSLKRFDKLRSPSAPRDRDSSEVSWKFFGNTSSAFASLTFSAWNASSLSKSTILPKCPRATNVRAQLTFAPVQLWVDLLSGTPTPVFRFLRKRSIRLGGYLVDVQRLASSLMQDFLRCDSANNGPCREQKDWFLKAFWPYETVSYTSPKGCPIMRQVEIDNEIGASKVKDLGPAISSFELELQNSVRDRILILILSSHRMR
ncbi:hypothetical protein E4T56_gene19141 [Termitomyces sp. T112]|nr:hypothetical protein E4T56_gene19141 [Termitomyces sp. T112]